MAQPWWWLGDEDCDALGLARGARRTPAGVVFGAEGGPRRVEVVARDESAPVKMGCISLRLWGDMKAPGAVDLLRRTAALLHARRGDGFDPDAAFAARDPEGGPEHAGAETVIDVPSVCERACVFCHVSRTPLAARRPRGSSAAVERAIDAAPGAVLFTGDDALAHPRIGERGGRAARRGERVSIIGPPRAGATAALAPALAAAGLARWITGIFGDSPASHDAIAGKAGAYAALFEAAAALAAERVAVELVTPLVAPVLPRLAAIAERAAALTNAPPALLVYAPDPVVGRAFDALVPDFAALRAALAALPPGARARAAGRPRCGLPPEARRGAPRRLDRTDPELAPVYPEATCGPCAARAACPGIPNTVARATGGRGLVTLSSS